MTKLEAAKKDVDYYVSLPYTAALRTEDGVVVARIKEMSGCVAHGDTAAQAYEHLLEVQRFWIEERLAAGLAVPEPVEEDESLPSGKWVQRVPRTLHKRLVDLARADGVSLNALVTAMLSEATALKGLVGIAPNVWKHTIANAAWHGWATKLIPDWTVMEVAQSRRGLLKRLDITQRLITDASRNPEETSHHSHKEGRGLVRR